MLSEVCLRLGVIVCGSKPSAGEAEMGRSLEGRERDLLAIAVLERHTFVFSRPTSELHLILILK